MSALDYHDSKIVTLEIEEIATPGRTIMTAHPPAPGFRTGMAQLDYLEISPKFASS